VEKRKPTFDLRTVKKLVKNPETRIITRQAFKETVALGWNEENIVTCIGQLSSQDFYKSMTTYTNSQIWQDVYYPTYEEVGLYVKVQIGGADENVVIISFKKR
jgi:motility quorum-sensing regulator/GCU-specific mRNA interferase toxin